jgi:hypothetical protein
MVRDYKTAQVYVTEADRVSTLSANLYLEARALWIGAFSSTGLGDFGKTMAQVHRGRKILDICGMSGGYLDNGMNVTQGEMHLLKSQYAEARNIYREIIETTSPDQNILFYGLTLVNICQQRPLGWLNSE